MATPDTLVIRGYLSPTDLVRYPQWGLARSTPILSRPNKPSRLRWRWGFEISIRGRYRNEEAVGEAMQDVFKAGTIERKDVFVATKLWNTNHRPERVKPAFDASRQRLQVDYVDCYLIHTPFAFRPGDEQDPRDERGQVNYNSGVTLVGAWGALERLVDDGHCKWIGLWDITLGEAARDRRGCAHQARRGASRIPSVSSRMGPARLLSGAWDCAAGVCSVGTCLGAESFGRPGHQSHCSSECTRHRLRSLLAWAVQRGTAFLTTSTTPAPHPRELRHFRPYLKTPCGRFGSASPTSSRFNTVVETGVPGFIPRAR